MSKHVVALLVAALLIPRSAQMKEAQRPAESARGFIANRVHPGDPVQEIQVAGFFDWASASAFAGGSTEANPVFQRKLARNESVRFADAAHPGQAAVLVFYTQDEHGQRTPLSMSRAHADLPLAIGSCGYQLLLGLDRADVSPPPSEGVNR